LNPEPQRWVAIAHILRARGNKGEVAAADELRTAGKPVAVVAAADRAAIVPSFDDVSIVSVTVKDAGGAENPRASDLVTFAISGPGQIIAVDNGDAASHESYQGSQRHLFNGRAIAIVRANGTGPITVTASVEGLTPASTKIEGVQKR